MSWWAGSFFHPRLNWMTYDHFLEALNVSPSVHPNGQPKISPHCRGPSVRPANQACKMKDSIRWVSLPVSVVLAPWHTPLMGGQNMNRKCYSPNAAFQFATLRQTIRQDSLARGIFIGLLRRQAPSPSPFLALPQTRISIPFPFSPWASSWTNFPTPSREGYKTHLAKKW